jgi:hypothetical protein
MNGTEIVSQSAHRPAQSRVARTSDQIPLTEPKGFFKTLRFSGKANNNEQQNGKMPHRRLLLPDREGELLLLLEDPEEGRERPDPVECPERSDGV